MKDFKRIEADGFSFHKKKKIYYADYLENRVAETKNIQKFMELTQFFLSRESYKKISGYSVKKEDNLYGVVFTDRNVVDVILNPYEKNLNEIEHIVLEYKLGAYMAMAEATYFSLRGDCLTFPFELRKDAIEDLEMVNKGTR